jgi:hypothetical protein
MNEKQSHTAGPWSLETVTTSIGSCHKIGPFPSLSVYEKTYACIYADNVSVGDEKHSNVGTELLANARLIAASPILYEYAAKKSAEGDEEARKMLDLLLLIAKGGTK